MFHVDCGKGFCALSWLAYAVDRFHAVNSVCPHFVAVIVKGKQIIVAVVDNQFVRADDTVASVLRRSWKTVLVQGLHDQSPLPRRN